MFKIYETIREMRISGKISEEKELYLLNAYLIKKKILERDWYNAKGKERKGVKGVGFYKMAKGDYRGMDLRFLDLSYVDFGNSDLRGAKFYGSVLYNTGISSVRINGDEFRGSLIRDSTIRMQVRIFVLFEQIY